MPRYKYEQRDKSGKIKEGYITARNEDEARILLQKRGIQPVSLIETKLFGVQFFTGKVKLKDLVLFTRQFATLVSAGLPINQALDLLARQTESKTLSRVLDQIRKKIESGQSLYDSFSEHQRVFDRLYCNLLSAGEQGGFLDKVLNRLAGYLEKTAKLKRELKVALIYPLILVFVSVVVVAVILIFVIPTFKEIFSEFGAALPLPTRIVIEISNFLVAYWYLIFGAIGLLGFFSFKYFKSEKGRKFLDPLILKLPVFGKIALKASIAKFTRTLSTMLSSGVPIIQSLESCAKVAGNVVIEEIIKVSTKSISEGKSLNETLKQFPIFPPMVIGMIAVGESTGALDAMLEKLAGFYEEEVETAIQSMKQLVEPVLILIIGAIIGGLVIAMYLPIFKLGSVIG